MDVVACPDPSCPAPAWVSDRWTWASTDGRSSTSRPAARAATGSPRRPPRWSPTGSPTRPPSARSSSRAERARHRRTSHDRPAALAQRPPGPRRPGRRCPRVPVRARRPARRQAGPGGRPHRPDPVLPPARRRGRAGGGRAGRPGFGKGDVLALSSPNLPEYAVAMYGAMAAGGVVTGANPLLTAGELAGQLADAAPRCWSPCRRSWRWPGRRPPGPGSPTCWSSARPRGRPGSPTCSPPAAPRPRSTSTRRTTWPPCSTRAAPPGCPRGSS
jgi:hypothetical protein